MKYVDENDTYTVKKFDKLIGEISENNLSNYVNSNHFREIISDEGFTNEIKETKNNIYEIISFESKL